MKISYGITVHNEADELNKLLEILIHNSQEEEEIISKAEEGKTEEEKAEQRFYYEKALAIEDEIESIENVEKSGEQLTPQQDAFKEMFKAIGGANKFKEILGGKHPEKALELIVDIYSGISMNQGKKILLIYLKFLLTQLVKVFKKK